MKTTIAMSIVFALSAGAVPASEKEEMKFPEPQKEHQWLMQFVGDWEAQIRMFMEPGKAPEMTLGSESVRAIGGFWILAEDKGTFMGRPFHGILTLGYDTGKKKYVGTWVDSVNSYLWSYEGALDATGKILTLESEGPCPSAPGKMAKVKESIEFKDKNHRVFTSMVQDEKGEWVKMLTIDYRRK